jgi:hypothetical protein
MLLLLEGLMLLLEQVLLLQEPLGGQVWHIIGTPLLGGE